MTIKDVFKKVLPKKAKELFSLEENDVMAFGFSRPEIPEIIEKKNVEWVFYGEKNDYPEKLNELLSTCAIHNAIVEGKASMMAGSGFLINDAIDKKQSEEAIKGLDAETKKNLEAFIKNENGEPISEINKKTSRTWQKNGSMAFEVVWSMDWSKIATIKYLNTDNIRAGKMSAGKVSEYWYSRDWARYKEDRYKPKKIIAFDPKYNEKPKEERLEYNQVIYIKNGSLEYYGEPSYKGAMSWINIDSQMGLFHLSNIENGFAPSLAFKFYKKPNSPEDRQMILDGIKKQWSGAKNAGKALVFFSENKELAPDVNPIEVSNIDKQFMVLAELAVQQILSGHKVTSPLLFGISIPGKLGGSTELETSYRIFDNSVVEPDRNQLEKVYNMLLQVNKIPVTIKIDKFNPLREEITSSDNTTINALNSLSPLVANKVLESMSADEIRGLIGLGPVMTPVTPPTNNPPTLT